MVKRKNAINYDRLSSSYSIDGKPETGDVPGYQLYNFMHYIIPYLERKI